MRHIIYLTLFLILGYFYLSYIVKTTEEIRLGVNSLVESMYQRQDVEYNRKPF